jgi:hypothetical protein
LDRFLLEFANRKLPEGADRLFTKYQAFLAGEVQGNRNQLENYQLEVRKAWRAPDRWTREYHLARVRVELYECIVKRVREELGPDWVGIADAVPGGLASGLPQITPMPDPFGRVLDRLSDLGSLGRLATCGNPSCVALFFIAQRKSQRYCTEKCAGIFQQEHKRKWWREHGNEWRKQKEKSKRGEKS